MSYLGQVNQKGDYHGYGKYVWEDSSNYTGVWQNGEFHGRGTYVWPDGDKYIGDWVNGRRTGQGIFLWVNGDIYQGSFLNGKRHGEGTQWHADGNKYQGHWFDGERHGRGLFFIAASKAIYDVNWVNGHAMGFGRFMTAERDIYEGYFLNGKRHGEGTFTWADGSRIAGHWQNGVRDDSKVKDLPPKKSEWSPPDPFLNSKPLPITHFEPPAPAGWDSNQPILLARPKFSDNMTEGVTPKILDKPTSPNNHNNHNQTPSSSTPSVNPPSSILPPQNTSGPVLSSQSNNILPQREIPTKSSLMVKQNSQAVISTVPKPQLSSRVSNPHITIRNSTRGVSSESQKSPSSSQDPSQSIFNHQSSPKPKTDIESNGIQQNEKIPVLPIGSSKIENNDMEKSPQLNNNADISVVEESTKSPQHKNTNSSMAIFEGVTPRLKATANATATATVTATKTIKKKISKVLSYNTRASRSDSAISPKNETVVSPKSPETNSSPEETPKEGPKDPPKKSNIDKVVKSFRSGSVLAFSKSSSKKDVYPKIQSSDISRSDNDAHKVSTESTSVEQSEVSQTNSLKSSKSAPLPTPKVNPGRESKRKNLPPRPDNRKANKFDKFSVDDLSNPDSIESIQMPDLQFATDVEDEFDLLNIDKFIDKRIAQIPTIPETDIESNPDLEIGNIIPLIPVDVDIDDIDLDSLSTQTKKTSSMTSDSFTEPIQIVSSDPLSSENIPLEESNPDPPLKSELTVSLSITNNLPTTTASSNNLVPLSQNKYGQIEIPKELEEQIKNFEKLEPESEQTTENKPQHQYRGPVRASESSYVPGRSKKGHLTKFFDELVVDFDFDTLKNN